MKSACNTVSKASGVRGRAQQWTTKCRGVLKIQLCEACQVWKLKLAVAGNTEVVFKSR